MVERQEERFRWVHLGWRKQVRRQFQRRPSGWVRENVLEWWNLLWRVMEKWNLRWFRTDGRELWIAIFFLEYCRLDSCKWHLSWKYVDDNINGGEGCYPVGACASEIIRPINANSFEVEVLTPTRNKSSIINSNPLTIDRQSWFRDRSKFRYQTFWNKEHSNHPFKKSKLSREK